MSFGDYVFAVFATISLVMASVACWLTAITAVQAVGGELAPTVILYTVNVLVNIGALVVIVKVWRP